MLSTFFSVNQNGSNLVQVLLSNISSYAENPGIFNFFKDSLVPMHMYVHTELLYGRRENQYCEFNLALQKLLQPNLEFSEN